MFLWISGWFWCWVFIRSVMSMWGFQFDLGMSICDVDVGISIWFGDVGSNRCGAGRGDAVGEFDSIRTGSFFFGSCEPIGVGSIFVLGAGFRYWCRLIGAGWKSGTYGHLQTGTYGMFCTSVPCCFSHAVNICSFIFHIFFIARPKSSAAATSIYLPMRSLLKLNAKIIHHYFLIIFPTIFPYNSGLIHQI